VVHIEKLNANNLFFAPIHYKGEMFSIVDSLMVLC